MAVGRKIDHVVVAAKSLERLVGQYESLGFTLTPLARHPDPMGTSNRLVQLPGRNFIELLEVDRPAGVTPHDFAARPPTFSFGAQNKARLERGEGISLLVLQSTDAAADLAAWRKDDALVTYAPFDFERKARLPDGAEVTVAFSLDFVTSPLLPDLGFFVCQSHFPEYFWKPEYQRHANGAQRIASIYLSADEPAAVGEALSRITGGEVAPVEGGVAVGCGEGEQLVALTPHRLAELAPGALPPPARSPDFVGLRIATTGASGHITPADDAGGLFIEWVAA